eukprot:491066_1
MTMLLPLFVALITVCNSELELIWYDSMDNYTSHWLPDVTSEQISSTSLCTSSNCVKIPGTVNQDNWIIRTVALPIIQNLDAYHSFHLQFDVILDNMESPNYCIVSYKYDTDLSYQTLRSFVGTAAASPVKLFNQTATILIDSTSNNNILHIRLETDGDSSAGNDFCYFDNVYLFGHILDKNVIFYDDMSDFNATGWTISNSVSVSQMSSSAYCSSAGCVVIYGHDATDNSIQNFIPNIHMYFDIFIEYDVYLWNVESDNSCQVWYKYDTDSSSDYYLIRNIPGGNGDYLYGKNIVTIPDDPKYKNSSVLYIKFATFGNSASGNDHCYFDNIYVKGTKLNATNQQILSNQIMNMRRQDNELEHVIIIGDMGGTGSAPYYTEEQVVTADLLSTISKYHNISGIIALGDNMYPAGVINEYSHRFNDTFENVYTHTNLQEINWYFTTGNHDYGGNITGEVEYTKHSTRWKFPSLYYTKSWYFGENNEIELLWVALDTYILCGLVTDSGTQADCIPPDVNKAQIHWQWLNDTLSNSNATFKLVGGHTPIYSYAHHGPTVQLIDQLNPLLRFHNVHAYIFGHDHVLQFIEDVGCLQHIGSGAGHGCRDSFPHLNSELNPSNDSLKYMDCAQGGFVRIEINVKKITMQAFYYLPTSSNVQFFSGIWSPYCTYKTIDQILYDTLSPTSIPTVNPTTVPSISPTTNEPTTSQPTTAQPTEQPTLFPTVEPIFKPTFHPTTQPIIDATLFIIETEQTKILTNKNNNKKGKFQVMNFETYNVTHWIVFSICLLFLAFLIGLVAGV